MPQLQDQGPTYPPSRWGTKLAVAVDAPFFEAIWRPEFQAIPRLGQRRDIIWLVPEVSDAISARGGPLRKSDSSLRVKPRSDKLCYAATTVKRAVGDSRRHLYDKLKPVSHFRESFCRSRRSTCFAHLPNLA